MLKIIQPKFFKFIFYPFQKDVLKVVFLFLLFNSFFFSCTKKTANVIQAKPNQETYSAKVDTIAPMEKTTFEEAINPMEKRPPTILIPKDYLVASLGKTECYGHCPVYDFKIFGDGKAKLTGKKYVNRIGDFIAEVDEVTLQNIKDKGEELGISQMQDNYPTNKFFIRDLPMTFISFHNGSSAKIIRNNYDAPKALLEYEKFLEKIIEQLNWKRADQP